MDQQFALGKPWGGRGALCRGVCLGDGVGFSARMVLVRCETCYKTLRDVMTLSPPAVHLPLPLAPPPRPRAPPRSQVPTAQAPAQAWSSYTAYGTALHYRVALLQAATPHATTSPVSR